MLEYTQVSKWVESNSIFHMCASEWCVCELLYACLRKHPIQLPFKRYLLGISHLFRRRYHRRRVTTARVTRPQIIIIISSQHIIINTARTPTTLSTSVSASVSAVAKLCSWMFCQPLLLLIHALQRLLGLEKPKARAFELCWNRSNVSEWLMKRVVLCWVVFVVGCTTRGILQQFGYYREISLYGKFSVISCLLCYIIFIL